MLKNNYIVWICVINDIRIPNICFDQYYNAVLIDIDRCSPINLRYHMFGESTSCMYNIKHLKGKHVTGIQTDHMQLGWLAAFILDNTQDEHNRTWAQQN